MGTISKNNECDKVRIRNRNEQVCVQLPTSADNVARPAVATARRAVAWLRCC